MIFAKQYKSVTINNKMSDVIKEGKQV